MGRLLVTLGDGETTYYLSDDFVNDTHQWDAKIVKPGTVKYATTKPWGGECKPTFGQMTLLPDLAAEKYSITVQWTETDEASAWTVFEGTLHRKAPKRQGNIYRVEGQDNDVAMTGPVYNDNLNALFTTYCGESYLNRTLDASAAARAATTDVDYRPTGKTSLRADLGKICEFFCFAFREIGSTIYLIDMLADNGSQSVDEFQFAEADYDDPPPYSLFKSGGYEVSGSHPEGKELSITPACHDTQANIEAAMADIKTVAERNGARLPIVMALVDAVPKFAEKISWVDESHMLDKTGWLRVNSQTYDFSRGIVTIDGRGEVVNA